MKGLRIMSFFLAACVLAGPLRARAVTVEKAKKQEEDIIKQKLAAIDPVVKEAIRRGDCPGAVVVVGQNGKVVYRKAFGHRALVPRELPMNVRTIFDMASVTKVVATTTAIMQLVEQGKIILSAHVSEYWPEFQANGKESISVRELMTHYSGLPPDLELQPEWSGYDTAMKMIVDTKLQNPPGTRFVYSDINFETLGELVRRVSGQSLDVYCLEHIFKPLGMKATRFKPPASWRKRIAPTQYQEGDKGKMLWGEVHDPTAYNMGGVAGHAGLFSSADDLEIFAQMLLNGGSYKHARILSPLSVEKMTSPQTPPDKMVVRGLGWDLDSPFASNRGELFEVGSFGHTGFTGTDIWIDPVTKTYLIILTNRVHPNGKGDVVQMRIQIANVVAGALGPSSAEQVLASRRSLTGYFELMRGYREQGLRNGKVQVGVDALEAENFAPLQGKRVGLITNSSGVDAAGRRTIDLLAHAPGVKLVALFSPEHGLAGRVDARVASTTDEATGLPVYSLYGDVERPTDKMLEGLDALVFDIQDAGVRFYTYTTTLGYCLEAAAKKDIDFYVLDRPNPINGREVQGPVLDNDLRSFVAYFPEPVRHGMTVGELAQMFNGENHLGAKLHVVKMQGWQRTDWYDETGLAWMNPSPNLRNATEEVLYPGVAMVEGAKVSVGRGTDTPFEILGAPWVVAHDLAAYLNARNIQGVRFLPVDFQPSSSSFANQVCHGVQILLIDRQALDSPAFGLEIVHALWKLYPNAFDVDKTLPLVGARWVLKEITAGVDPRRIVYEWQEPLEQFRTVRSKYLLY
jgi:uncharacterized protein YbbC (DUF1343 family)/CubicO group peptidase (beta-lactamase class C family)